MAGTLHALGTRSVSVRSAPPDTQRPQGVLDAAPGRVGTGRSLTEVPWYDLTGRRCNMRTSRRPVGRSIIIIIIASGMIGANAWGAGSVVLHVDDDAAPGGDGLSWSSAFRYLQDALAAAAGGGVTEIRVAQGTYLPDEDDAGNVVPGDITMTFQLVWNYHNNAMHVATSTATDETTLLDGFTLAAGNAHGPPPEPGGQRRRTILRTGKPHPRQQLHVPGQHGHGWRRSGWAREQSDDHRLPLRGQPCDGQRRGPSRPSRLPADH